MNLVLMIQWTMVRVAEMVSSGNVLCIHLVSIGHVDIKQLLRSLQASQDATSQLLSSITRTQRIQ